MKPTPSSLPIVCPGEEHTAPSHWQLKQDLVPKLAARGYGILLIELSESFYNTSIQEFISSIEKEKDQSTICGLRCRQEMDYVRFCTSVLKQSKALTDDHLAAITADAIERKKVPASLPPDSLKSLVLGEIAKPWLAELIAGGEKSMKSTLTMVRKAKEMGMQVFAIDTDTSEPRSPSIASLVNKILRPLLGNYLNFIEPYFNKESLHRNERIAAKIASHAPKGVIAINGSWHGGYGTAASSSLGGELRKLGITNVLSVICEPTKWRSTFSLYFRIETAIITNAVDAVVSNADEVVKLVDERIARGKTLQKLAVYASEMTPIRSSPQQVEVPLLQRR